jgi:hypothetical protein
VTRESDPTADQTRSPVDFYSPDTFNFATLDISAGGATLTVTVTGINSRPTNSFGEYDPVNNPARQILSFQVDAFTPCTGPVCGQHNTPCATMLVNGIGLDAQGPVPVSSPAATYLAFDWRAIANAPLGLMAGNSVPGQRPFGGGPVVDLDLSSSFPLFSGFDPFWGGLFHTDAQGLAGQAFRVPSGLTGFVLNAQGVVFDLTNACSSGGFLTTASFAIHF